MKILEAKFLSELLVKQKENGSWELTEDLVYQSKQLDKVITVPKGFITDFASVPRLPLAYLFAGNTAHREAVVHDYLYRTLPHICRRSTADKVFLEAMKSSDVPRWRRELMYLAVRGFGGGSWK